MSEEKQIEEMKLIIDKAEEEYSEIWNEWFYDHKEGTKIDHEFLFFAKMLYDEGYRKQSDTVRKIQLKMAMHYGTYTDKDMTPITEVFRVLDQIAKETLEE